MEKKNNNQDSSYEENRDKKNINIVKTLERVHDHKNCKNEAEKKFLKNKEQQDLKSKDYYGRSNIMNQIEEH